MKKLKNKKGFTLVEMLACVVTMLLVAGVCSMGTNVALDSYNRSVFVSDSQMLESTIDIYLGDFFRFGTVIKQEENPDVPEDQEQEELLFKNISYGVYRGKVALKDGRLYIYKDAEDTEGTLLLNENVYTKGLTITNFHVEYNESTNCITGNYTIESTVVDDAKKECTFTYRLAMVY